MRHLHSPAAPRTSRSYPYLERLEDREVLSGLPPALPPPLGAVLNTATSLVPTQPPLSNLPSLLPAPVGSSTSPPGANGPGGLLESNVSLDLAASILGILLNASLDAGANAGASVSASASAAVTVAGPDLVVNIPAGAGNPGGGVGASGLINMTLQLSGGGGGLGVGLGASEAAHGTGDAAAEAQPVSSPSGFAAPTAPAVAAESAGASADRSAPDRAAAAAPLASAAVQSGGTPAGATPNAADGPATVASGGDAAPTPAPAQLPPGVGGDDANPADRDSSWRQFHPDGFGPCTDVFPLGQMATWAGRSLEQLTEPHWRLIWASSGLVALAVALAVGQAVKRKTQGNRAAPSTHPEWEGPEPR